MQSISLKAKVNSDGKLTVQLPQEFAEQELDLVIVYQAIKPKDSDDLHDVVDNFYGSLADDPILEEQNQREIA